MTLTFVRITSEYILLSLFSRHSMVNVGVHVEWKVTDVCNMFVLGDWVSRSQPWHAHVLSLHLPVCYKAINTHTRLTALCPVLPGWASTRKVEPIWILLKQKTVSGSGISWAICKSAPRSRQTTTPAPHHSVFYRPDALPAAQPTASKHWRQVRNLCQERMFTRRKFLMWI